MGDFEFDETSITGYDPEEDQHFTILFNSLNTSVMIAHTRAGTGPTNFYGEGPTPYEDCTGKFQVREVIVSETETLSEVYFETNLGTWRRYNQIRSLRVGSTEQE